MEEVVRGLLGFAVAAWEAEDEVWKLLDLVALGGGISAAISSSK